MPDPIATRATLLDGLPAIAEQAFTSPHGNLAAGGMDGFAVAKLNLNDQGAVGLISFNADGSAVVVPVTIAGGRIIAEVIQRCCAEIEAGNLDA